MSQYRLLQFTRFLSPNPRGFEMTDVYCHFDRFPRTRDEGEIFKHFLKLQQPLKC